MLAKTLFILGLIVVSSARSIHRYELGERYYYLKALKQQEAANRHKNYYRPVNDYNFGYSVNDRYTGDVKSHRESRKDGVVKGRYQLLDADGYRRIVDYTADDIHGFNAFVRRVPIDLGARRFGGPFGTLAPSYVTPAPYTPLLATAAPPTYNFGGNINKFFPIVNNDLNNYVSDYFNGYTEGSFDQYY